MSATATGTPYGTIPPASPLPQRRPISLPRLAQMKPGQAVCFSVVNAAQAKQALLDRETQWKWWAYGISFGLPEAPINKDLTGGWPRVDWD